MKVIHLISGGDTGGAKTHVHSLLQGLNRHIQADMVCFTDGPFTQEARELGIRVDVIATRNPLAALKPLREKIAREGYDIIHCHGARGNLMGALLKRSTGLPVVTSVHSDPRLDYMGRPLSALTFGTLNAWALRRIPYRIGVSDAMADLLVSRGFDPQQTFSIYNGIDFTPRVPKLSRREFLDSLGLTWPDDAVIAGIAARLNPVKDMGTLLRGFAAAHREQPQLRLIIAGDGQDEAALKQLAAELGVAGEVCFAGWLSDTDSFYNALDINTLTSLSETFSYALTEGARFRLATVSTAVGGIPNLIDTDVNGYLFSPGDWKTLGRHLANLGNNDSLRQEMGERLYQKASSQFSIQKTVDTQLHIYSEILRRHARPKRSRDGVVICGAYGRGNAGDDAILEAILQEMRSIDPDMPITVLSKNPRETRLTYRVRSVSRMNFPGWLSAMKHAKLYLNGGGSLIQDVTSRRSLWFYLINIRAAKRAGCTVQMYGCGIGPVTRGNHRALSAKVLNRYVDAITLREPDSRDELKSMGVTEPEILLTADPALTLHPAGDDEVDSVLLRAGIPPRGRYIGFALRQWPGFAEKAPLFGQAARYAYETYGLTPVFVAVEKAPDSAANLMATQGMDGIPRYFLDNAGSAGAIIGALARMEALVSMRLHALIFAAGQGIPLAGVVYDPKVSSFLRYIGQDLFTDLDALTAENLRAMVDQTAARAAHPETQAAAVARLQEIEHGNVSTAKRLLGM